MIVTARHLDLISRIYDVVLDEAAWPDLLDQLAIASNAKYANLIMSDFTSPEVNVAAASFDESLQATYRDVYADSERGMAVNMMTYPVHQFLSDEDLCTWGIPWNEMPSIPWLKREAGVFRRITTRLNDTGAWLDGLTYLFADGRGQMTPAERETARIFLPHVAKAVELTRPFQLLKARFRGVLSVLDRLHIGVFLLSDTGALIVKNAEADRILDLKDGLSLDARGHLRTGTESGGNTLAAAIEAAAATARADGSSAGTLLVLRRRSNREAFLLTVAPLMATRTELENGIRGAMVFAIDPGNRSVISTEGMEKLYGLTAAEMRVCGLLIDGHQTQAIADLRNVSLETVRTQVKSILAKTGTSKRSDVVRLALTVNLPVDRPGAGTGA